MLIDDMSVNTQESQGLTYPPLPTPSLRLNFDNSALNLVEMLMYGSVDGVMASLSPWVARAAWIVMPKRSDSPQKLQVGMEDPARLRSWRAEATSVLESRSGWLKGIVDRQLRPSLEEFSVSLLR